MAGGSVAHGGARADQLDHVIKHQLQLFIVAVVAQAAHGLGHRHTGTHEAGHLATEMHDLNKRNTLFGDLHVETLAFRQLGNAGSVQRQFVAGGQGRRRLDFTLDLLAIDGLAFVAKPHHRLGHRSAPTLLLSVK